jgi:general secretion pathway protein D
VAIAQPAVATEKTKDGVVQFQFKNADVIDVLQAYMKATGQKFVIDPSIHGKITILNPRPVKTEEAFNLLSSSLATNQIAISEQGDTMVVASARNLQHGFVGGRAPQCQCRRRQSPTENPAIAGW